MSEERSREIREIEEAAEGYAGNHRANRVRLAVWPIGIGWMLLAAWLVETGLRWAGISRESASGQSLFLKIFFPLVFAGILALIVTFAIWYERWRKRKLGVETKAEARPQTAKHFLFVSLVYGPLAVVMPREICEHVPLRFAPLAIFLALVVPPLLAVMKGWLPRVEGLRGAWRESPVATVAVGMCAAYALAAATGLPQPWAEEAGSCRHTLRVMAPFAVIWAVSLMAGAWYSNYQLRRLQRLLSEEGKGDE